MQHGSGCGGVAGPKGRFTAERAERGRHVSPGGQAGWTASIVGRAQGGRAAGSATEASAAAAAVPFPVPRCKGCLPGHAAGAAGCGVRSRCMALRPGLARSAPSPCGTSRRRSCARSSPACAAASGRTVPRCNGCLPARAAAVPAGSVGGSAVSRCMALRRGFLHCACVPRGVWRQGSWEGRGLACDAASGRAVPRCKGCLLERTAAASAGPVGRSTISRCTALRRGFSQCALGAGV